MVSKGNQVIVDYQKKLPGRGVYVCLSENCIHSLFRRNLLNRALRKKIEPLFQEDLKRNLFHLLKKEKLGVYG